VKSERAAAGLRVEALRDFDLAMGGATQVIVGIDEAGRGPLAGPVVAAAVCFDYNREIPEVDDSKKLSETQREKLYAQIVERAIGWGVGVVDHEEIDKINILQATYKAMHAAVQQLTVSWNLLLVDGNRKIPHIAQDLQRDVVKGDAKSAAIAAASIIAKVTRDRMMDGFDARFPGYGFLKHKGYGTKAHCDYIKKYGLTTIHRRSFCSNLVLQTELAL